MVERSGDASWRRCGKRRGWQGSARTYNRSAGTRESLDGEERRGTLELLRSGDGVRRAASWRVRREPRAKEAGPTRRLGETTRRTRLELDDPFGRVNVDDSVSGFTTHTATHME